MDLLFVHVVVTGLQLLHRVPHHHRTAKDVAPAVKIVASPSVPQVVDPDFPRADVVLPQMGDHLRPFEQPLPPLLGDVGRLPRLAPERAEDRAFGESLDLLLDEGLGLGSQENKPISLSLTSSFVTYPLVAFHRNTSRPFW